MYSETEMGAMPREACCRSPKDALIPTPTTNGSCILDEHRDASCLARDMASRYAFAAA